MKQETKMSLYLSALKEINFAKEQTRSAVNLNKKTDPSIVVSKCLSRETEPVEMAISNLLHAVHALKKTTE